MSVSVVIPLFNGAEYVVRAIESCFMQTWPEVQVVVVDDGSADNSLEKVRGMVPPDGKSILLLEHQKNKGTFAARATGVNGSNGKYVIFLDPDDILSKDCASSLWQQMEVEKAEIGFFGMAEEGRRGLSASSRLPRLVEGDEILSEIFLESKNPSWGIGGKCVSKDLAVRALKCLEYVDKRFILAEDALFVFACAALAKKMAVVERDLYFYKVNAASITKSPDRVMERDAQFALALEYFDKLTAKEISENRNFTKAKKRSVSILKGSRYANRRHVDGYLKCCGQAWGETGNVKFLMAALLCSLTLGMVRK